METSFLRTSFFPRTFLPARSHEYPETPPETGIAEGLFDRGLDGVDQRAGAVPSELETLGDSGRLLRKPVLDALGRAPIAQLKRFSPSSFPSAIFTKLGKFVWQPASELPGQRRLPQTKPVSGLEPFWYSVCVFPSFVHVQLTVFLPSLHGLWFQLCHSLETVSGPVGHLFLLSFFCVAPGGMTLGYY